MTDPTTRAIEDMNDDRDRLRAEVDRLSKRGDARFVDGYDQAVREIRDYFKEARQAEVVAEIEKIWLTEKRS